MDLKDFLAHHGIHKNPFAEEDARSDQVFKHHCIDSTHHPCWDKIYGDPADPSTAIVFGEKGSGKTALRMQIAKEIQEYNRQNDGQRCFIVNYDDFNPFLDQYRERFPRRRAEKVLREFQLWDHIDAILAIAVTQLVDGIFKSRGQKASDEPTGDEVPSDFRRRLTKHQRRDLLLLAACYDNSTAAPRAARWTRLQRRLMDFHLGTWATFMLGLLVTVGGIAAAAYVYFGQDYDWQPWYGWVVATAVPSRLDSVALADHRAVVVGAGHSQTRPRDRTQVMAFVPYAGSTERQPTGQPATAQQSPHR